MVTARPLVPGLIWAASAPTGCIAALGTIRRTQTGFGFFGHPDNQDGRRARQELVTRAGIATHEWQMDGFRTVDAVVAYLNDCLKATRA